MLLYYEYDYRGQRLMDLIRCERPLTCGPTPTMTKVAHFGPGHREAH